jgi:hypothetical protein
MVHQCPQCELRFATQGEMKQHLAQDHGLPTEGLEPYGYPRAPAMRGLYDELDDPAAEAPGLRRYLVVANETLVGATLLDELARRAAAGPSTFLVVVPATQGVTGADWRLRQALEALEVQGIEARGEVGSPDPVRAVTTVLAREPIDEIIVSTLPASVSPWLGADLPGRLRHRTRLPVSTVVASPDAGTSRQVQSPGA